MLLYAVHLGLLSVYRLAELCDPGLERLQAGLLDNLLPTLQMFFASIANSMEVTRSNVSHFSLQVQELTVGN